MKPYTEDTTCPKCETTWRAHTAKVTYCGGGTQTIKQDGEVISVHTLPDFLNCACGNCGYEWLMECADAERAEPSPEEYDGPPEPVTVYCPVDIDCSPYTGLIELAIKIRCTDVKWLTVGDKVDAIVME